MKVLYLLLALVFLCSCTFSIEAKTMEFERSLLDYFTDPDLLDIEVVLEEK